MEITESEEKNMISKLYEEICTLKTENEERENAESRFYR